MKKLLLALALLLLPASASAQCGGVFGASTACGSVAGGIPGQIAFSSITGNAITGLSGDATATGPGVVPITLATVNANTGAFGSATQCVTVTNNAKGLTTAVSAATCTPAIGSITGLGTGVATALAANLNATGGIPSPTPTRAGDVIYWNGSAWTNLAGNNAGTKFIQEDSSGTPSWVVAPGTGTVTSVICGTFMTGGTITTTGTCNVTAVAKSDQTTGTSNVLAVTPLHQQDHDSAVKAWVSFTGTAGGCPAGACAILASYNAPAVSRTGTGTYVVTFSPTAFSSANYVCAANATNPETVFFSTKLTNQIALQTANAGSAADATTVDLHCMGRQ